MTFKHTTQLSMMAHRERILAKRKLYGAHRDTTRPFGLIEIFTTDDRRRFRLPHQGIKECARRIRNAA